MSTEEQRIAEQQARNQARLNAWRHRWTRAGHKLYPRNATNLFQAAEIGYLLIKAQIARLNDAPLASSMYTATAAGRSIAIAMKIHGQAKTEADRAAPENVIQFPEPRDTTPPGNAA